MASGDGEIVRTVPGKDREEGYEGVEGEEGGRRRGGDGDV